MIRNLENPQLSVNFLARKFHLSRAHFSRIFHRDSGMYPNDFIRHHRILLACSLLKNSHMSCKEIAGRLCFANAGNFSRSFQRTMGTNPLKFRGSGIFPVI
jgi:transcriptional regulator GlxA family with amidase domain